MSKNMNRFKRFYRLFKPVEVANTYKPFPVSKSHFQIKSEIKDAAREPIWVKALKHKYRYILTDYSWNKIFNELITAGDIEIDSENRAVTTQGA